MPDGDFYVSQLNLNDGSVEGISHRTLPVFSAQYHPEGAPGPKDNQHLYDRFLELVRTGEPALRAVGGARPETKPQKVLILGSGPLATTMIEEIESPQNPRYTVCGTVDDQEPVKGSADERYRHHRSSRPVLPARHASASVL